MNGSFFLVIRVVVAVVCSFVVVVPVVLPLQGAAFIASITCGVFTI